ncbi:reverse transcriptase domain-containing protein [Tanacetum coccineum]|uniref:Reverse transcriptase domain-containing protein n=1 Tax=Tanacetum coccineum TaxID=301880 RepID=A0ABQ4WUJ7_9ASTR
MVIAKPGVGATTPSVAHMGSSSMGLRRYQYLFTKEDANPRLIRWILLLQEFDIKIHDKKGAENLAADHLSRLENPDLGKLTKAEIRDLFTEEQLMTISDKGNEPWLFARFGMPKALISDRGTHFCNYQMEHAIKRKEWSHKLDDAMWAFRTVYKTPLGTTPFRIIYGKACHLLVELEDKAYLAIKACNMDLTKAGANRFWQINELDELMLEAYESSISYKERTKRWHDKRIKTPTKYEKGDKVLLFNSRMRLFPRKLKSRWYGPFKSKDMKNGAIELYDEDGSEFIVNKQRVKPYQKDALIVDKDDDITLADEGEVIILQEVTNRIGCRNFFQENECEIFTEAEDGVRIIPDSVRFLALGWLLEEIHVTWAHLEKKWTRLRLYTRSLEEIIIQTVETASPTLATASKLDQDDCDHDSLGAFLSYEAKRRLEIRFCVERKLGFLRGVGQKELGGKKRLMKAVRSSSHVSIVPSLSSSNHVFASPISKLTKADLVGPVYNLLKGTCKSCVELKYNMEECYRALSDQLDWNNPEGNHYPYDLSKPLSLYESRGRLIVLADFFFNNDLEYLRGGCTDRKYSASTTKTKAAKYEIEGIEDMVTKLWSPIKVAYDKHDIYSTMRILGVTSVTVDEWYGYGYLKEIVMRRVDQKLYKFMEGDFPRLHLNDIKDMLLLVTQNKLNNLDNNVIVHLALGVESCQKMLNISKP